MSKENLEDQKALREMLQFFLDEMEATQVELSEGMGVSRPVVINFLNKDKKQRLPVDRQGLINLWSQLQNRRISQRKLKTESKKTTPELESNPNQLRELLKESGSDELLESAGFLPENTNIIKVTQDKFFHVAQVVALLEFLDFDNFFPIIQEFLAIATNKIANTSQHLVGGNAPSPEDDYLAYLIAQLQESKPELIFNQRTLGLKLRLEVINKLQQAWITLKSGGKTKFSQQEAIRLFLSIAIKEQIDQHSPNFHLRVEKLEFRVLSKSIDEEAEYSLLYEQFIKIANQAELALKYPHLVLEKLPEEQCLNSSNAVMMAIITCRFRENNKPSRILELMYTSANNTMVENAIGACSLHMGLTKEVAEATLLTKTLDSSIDSLVETTVIMGKQKQYQGIWVDRDSMITILQAIVCGAKSWLADNSEKRELDLEIYNSAFQTLADLRKQLTKVRRAFQKFQFLDESSQEANPKLAEIKKIAHTAKAELQKIPNKEIYFSYRLNLYRCYFLAKRLELRLANIGGDINHARSLIAEIQQEFDLEENKKIKEELVPIAALMHSEVYLYELSYGHDPDLFTPSRRSNWLGLDKWVTEIRSTIKRESCYKDPGLDIYQALSEIYANVARIEFYLSNDRTKLEQAAAYFLTAAHYALRIGLIQRASKWFALAGRVWVRLGDEQLSKQASKLANQLARKDLTFGHSSNFVQAILSEIYLLEGERLLLIQHEPNKALDYFLNSLKGSVYLGLNRRICDALFNIYRCSQNLNNLSVKKGLSRVFKDEDKLTEANKIHLNRMDNWTSEKVLDLLCQLWNREDNPSWFQVRDEFSQLVVDILQGWHNHEVLEPAKMTKHPIVELIESKSWLGQISS